VLDLALERGPYWQHDDDSELFLLLHRATHANEHRLGDLVGRPLIAAAYDIGHALCAAANVALAHRREVCAVNVDAGDGLVTTEEAVGESVSSTGTSTGTGTGTDIRTARPLLWPQQQQRE
jgi:hypothetical protein